MSRTTSTLSEFLAAYDAMRELQKRFFDGDKTVVGRAIAAERKADRLREQLGDGTSATGNLFDQPDPNHAPVGVATVGSIWEEDSDEGRPWWTK